MDDQPIEVISATDASERLGVSASGLRRLGSIYAEVHGELLREKRTEKRIWTAEIIERLRQARALVEGERYRSIKEALEALDRGVDIDVDVAAELATPLHIPTPEALEVLLNEFKSMHKRLAALEGLEARLDTVERLEAEVKLLRQQLEKPTPQTSVTPEGTSEVLRMNAYLLGELERRRHEAETTIQRRAWWKFW